MVFPTVVFSAFSSFVCCLVFPHMCCLLAFSLHKDKQQLERDFLFAYLQALTGKRYVVFAARVFDFS